MSLSWYSDNLVLALIYYGCRQMSYMPERLLHGLRPIVSTRSPACRTLPLTNAPSTVFTKF